MIGKTLAQYQVTSMLGKGGMGEVYRATDTQLGREVALKILPQELSGDPERAARFEREARTLASLQHTNIASIYGYQDVDGLRFLAMELVEGEDLAERIARGALPVDDVVSIARQMALGLEAAHERNIVHRDLKPANVRIDADGVVKILDFGLARAYTGDAQDDFDPLTSPTITAAMTQVGVILGTAAYMSPEQARGKRIDKRSDIWSYGVILYEMLTGAQLYGGETVTDILGAIVRGAPDLDRLPRDTPPALRRLLERCLTPEASDRLRDIGEARYALAHLDEATTVEPEREAVGRSPRLVAILSLLLVLVTTAAVLLWMRPQPTEPVLQASITMPEGGTLQTLGMRGGSMRFSPDGQSLAFVVQVDGTRQIWVRDLSQRDARPVQGTEGGHRPFWSPDGKSLGFFYEGSLRRVDVEGGVPLTIAAAPDGRGGAWLDDGTVVFAPTPGSALSAVSASGGEARQVTQPGKFTHREPRALGHNGDFLFLENRQGGEWWVCVGNVDGRASREVVASGGGVEYAVGHLLYLRGSTLVAQPFDLDALSLSGEAVPIAELVFRDSDFGIGSFAASSRGDLVYQAGRGAIARLMIRDRSGAEVGEVGEGGFFNQVELSKDGTTIAAVIGRSQGGSDLWLIDTKKGVPQRFTFTPENDATRRSSPVWAHDGSRLFYSYEHDGDVSAYAKRTDGSGTEEQIFALPDRIVWPYDTSRDGKWLICGVEGADSAEDQWAVPLDGGEPRPIFETPFDEWPSRLSPDGRWLAFDSDEAGPREVYVVPFPSGAGKWQISRNGGRFPQWNEDGSELYYQSAEQGLMAVAIDISSEAFVAGEPTELFRAVTISGAAPELLPMGMGDRFLVLDNNLSDTPASLYMNWRASLAKR